MSARKVRFKVPAADAGTRLDQVLAKHVPGLSRRRARVLLGLGGVFVDARRMKIASRVMKAGEAVEAVLGGAFSRASKGEEPPLPSFSIVHEDADVIVVEKPAGLLTAPTPESDRNNLADQIARRSGRREKDPVFVVHRLDLETSGLLVLAKTPDANRELSELFRVHDIVREYLAVVAGAFPESASTVDREIDGRRAVTHFAVERRFGEKATLVRATLETGRTHQIRIHARMVGHPVLGDAKHGLPSELAPPRMALHATKLGFRHPATGETKTFESPLPPDLAGWIATLE